jgi:hypothetical protein
MFFFFQECVTFQHQLNIVRNVIRRLESAQGKVRSLPDVKDTQRMLSEACTDKLRVLGESLLDLLLYLVYEIGPVPRVSTKLVISLKSWWSHFVVWWIVDVLKYFADYCLVHFSWLRIEFFSILVPLLLNQNMAVSSLVLRDLKFPCSWMM